MKTYKVLCKCQHNFQDAAYGKGVRIANPTSKIHLDGTLDVRCTVCNTIHKVKKD
jgi:hypothetical protein